MFCPNCGAKVDSAFCPNCGTKIFAPSTKNEQFYQPENYTDQTSVNIINPQKSKKGGVIGAIIVLILVAAIVVTCILHPWMSFRKDNPFSQGKSNPLSQSLASIDNLIFNSNSFAVNINSDEGENLEFKVEFGDNLLNSKIIGSYEDDTLFYCNGEKIGACSYGDEIIFDIDGIVSTVDNRLLDGIYDFNALIPNLDGMVNKKIDYERLVHLQPMQLLQTYCLHSMNTWDRNSTEYTEGVEIINVFPDFDTVYRFLGDFVSNGLTESSYTYEKKNSNSGKSYSFDIRLQNVIKEFSQYVANNDKISAFINTRLGQYYLNELLSEFDVNDMLHLDIIIDKSGYISQLLISDDSYEVLKIVISDVNNTKISQSDFDAIQNDIYKNSSGSLDSININNFDSLIEAFE